MEINNNSSDNFLKLRNQAVASLKTDNENAEDLLFLSDDAKGRMIQELRIHQIELEMQNEELRRTQLELEAARNKYSDLYNFAPVGYFTIGENGLIIDVNHTGATMLGVEKSVLLKKRFSAFVTTDTQDILYHHRRQLIKTKTRQACELKIKKKSGETFHARLECNIFEDNTNLIQAIINDISKTKLAESKIMKARDEWEKTFNAIDEIVTIHDQNMRLVNMNRATYQTLKTSPDKLMGKTCYEIFRGGTQPCEGCPVWKSKVSKTAHTSEITHPNLGKTFLVSAFPFLDDNGELTGFVHTAKDITQQRKLESQLHQTQKLESLGILAGGIAHDFNNMLGIIIGNSSFALTLFHKDEELVEILSDIQAGAQQAQKLALQLLTFAKGGEPVKETANIEPIIKKAVKLVSSGANTKCQFEFPTDLWTVEVDPGQLNQVINNLLINSNQAMPDGGIIQIRAENIVIEPKNTIALPPGKYVKIIIKDQGNGISDNNISKIFDPYFSTKKKGSGFGLAISYSIINRHGGQISVESEIGAGTTFHVYLPASDKIIVKVEEKEKLKHLGYGKILIMDDKEFILKMAGRMLAQMGYKAFFATDGTQAIEMYQKAFNSKNPFDLVILDLTVPGGMGGQKTVAELLKIDSKVKAVVSSGYSNDPIMANYKDYGFCGVVPKPYTTDQLTGLIKKILEKKFK